MVTKVREEICERQLNLRQTGALKSIVLEEWKGLLGECRNGRAD